MDKMMRFLLFVFTFDRVFSAEWSYSGEKGPTHWAEVSAACGKNSQSPINIFEGDVKDFNITQNFVYTNYDTSSGVTMTLSNNGHTATVILAGTTAITVSGGGLPGTFRAIQFHFHWGSDSNTGSEHLLSSTAYPMEVHVVHFNTKYTNPNAAISEPDGLAVLGFMFEISSADNPHYTEIIGKLESIRNSGSSTTLEAVPLNNLLPEVFRKFYRYSGSLTTPNCQESVTWTVFKEPIKISERQLRVFRNLLDSHNHQLVNNYRPVQALNKRSVSSNFNPDIQWRYTQGHVDVTQWKDYYSSCGADSQSPIDIPMAGSLLDVRIPAFSFTNYNSVQGGSYTLKNNGYTADLDVSSGNMSISGGGLNETYQTAKVHFHWGATNLRGSEHTLNGQAYPMEVHVVHFRKSLSTLQRAVAQPEGLAFFGIFFELSEEINPALQPIIDGLTAIKNPGSSVQIPAFSLSSMLPASMSNFFRYSGSLTTPGCYQSVIWTVFPDTIRISATQLNTFRSLMSREEDNGQKIPMVDNFRPVQSLNRRVVTRNFVVISPAKAHWSYHGEHGPAHWGDEFPVCKDTPSSRQSPIDIQPKNAEFKKIVPFVFSNYDSVKGFTMQVKNNGHAAQVDIIGGDILISGGGLADTYKAIQFHFHWGSENKKGSEHLIDSKAYPMEVHIVHYNTIYPDLTTAVSRADGLAVLAFMYEISKDDNPAYDAIIDKLDDIEEPDKTESISPIALSSLLPENLLEFYRYQGSLTTPSCQESVTWTVFKSPIKISEDQLKKFRKLKSSHTDDTSHEDSYLVDNYRPPQNINSRVVHANFIININHASSIITTNNVVLLIVSLLLALH